MTSINTASARSVINSLIAPPDSKKFSRSSESSSQNCSHWPRPAPCIRRRWVHEALLWIPSVSTPGQLQPTQSSLASWCHLGQHHKRETAQAQCRGKLQWDAPHPGTQVYIWGGGVGETNWKQNLKRKGNPNNGKGSDLLNGVESVFLAALCNCEAVSFRIFFPLCFWPKL